MRDLSHLKLVMCGYDKDVVNEFIQDIDNEHKESIQQHLLVLENLREQIQRLESELDYTRSINANQNAELIAARERINFVEQEVLAQPVLEQPNNNNDEYTQNKEQIQELLNNSQEQVAFILGNAKTKHDAMINNTQTECDDMLQEARLVAATLIAEAKHDAKTMQDELKYRISTISSTVTVLRGIITQVAECCEITEQIVNSPDDFFKDLEAVNDTLKYRGID